MYPPHEPERKHQGVDCEHLTSSVKKKFKTEPSAGKVMLILFWGSQGQILEHHQGRGTTVNSVCDSGILQDQVRPTI
jgi:hypothetical protein